MMMADDNGNRLSSRKPRLLQNNDGEEIIDPGLGLDKLGLVVDDDDDFHPGWFDWIWNIL